MRSAVGSVLLGIGLTAALTIGTAAAVPPPAVPAPGVPAPIASAPVAFAPAAAVQTTTRQIGTSVRGRTIWAIHRTTPGATRRIVVIGQVHGNERAGTRVVQRLRIAGLPADVDLWLIPTANPDGLAAGTRTNARKVDLNRNFPYRWRRLDVGRTTYSGRRAASEPETRALQRFVTAMDPGIVVTFHQPLLGVGRNDKRPEVARAMAAATGLPLRTFHCTGICAGSFTSWVNRTRRGVAVTVEFGRTTSPQRLDRAAAAVLSVASRF